MYEHKQQPLASKRIYYKRILNNIGWSAFIITVMLLIGTAGYYYLSPDALLIDAFHNASMILAGMGPVLETKLTYAGKIFSSLYALFSGVIFITSIG
ncbi:MAG: hypothetical protein HYR66_06655, partial [Sphingobacteriales bacterium]|nr:hypothetical protein [Sphingobacteriales bacterium]